LRQNELALSMGWHRSRLSRQLTRMQARDRVDRAPQDDGVLVTLTGAGAAAAAAARPVHAQAIHDHLAARLSPAERSALLQLVTKLAD
jgi:DNA-binding MarR family transcriptional regulator